MSGPISHVSNIWSGPLPTAHDNMIRIHHTEIVNTNYPRGNNVERIVNYDIEIYDSNGTMRRYNQSSGSIDLKV